MSDYEIDTSHPITFKRLSDADLGRSSSSHQTHIGLLNESFPDWEESRVRDGVLFVEGLPQVSVSVATDPITTPAGDLRSPKIRAGGREEDFEGIPSPQALGLIREEAPANDPVLGVATSTNGEMMLFVFEAGGKWGAELGELGFDLTDRTRARPDAGGRRTVAALLRGWIDEGSEHRTRLRAEKSAASISETGDDDADAGRDTTYATDSVRRRAVELRAMEVATEVYAGEGFEVSDVSANRSYDLHCLGDEEIVHVEVKGTQGRADRVILTRNEVAGARKTDGGWRTDLVVVEGIILRRVEDHFVGENGKWRRLASWQPKDDHLSPTQYEYQVDDDDAASCDEGQTS